MKVAIVSIVAVAAIVAAGGAIFLLAGGDDSDGQSAADAGKTVKASPSGTTPRPTATDTPRPTATPTPLPGATRGNPLALGVSKRGFDGWEMFVVRSDFDVVTEVMARNPNNKLPSSGNTFLLVRVNATNREAAPDQGKTTTEYNAGLLVLVDANGRKHHTFDNNGCGVIPDGFAFIDHPQPRGGSVEGNICFHLPQDVTNNVVLFDDASDTWYALR